MDVDTFVAAGLSGLATLAGAGYAVWRQQFREIAYEMNLSSMPRLDDNLNAHARREVDLDLDLVREIARKAAMFGGQMRELGEELFIYVSMWKHPSDAANLRFYTGPERLEDWIARRIGNVRREISYRIYFDVQPFRHRVKGWPAERTRRRKAAKHDRPLREALKKRSPI